MTGAIYLACFGLFVMTSLFLTLAWGTLAFKRARRIKGVRALYHDRYMVLATALTVLSIGTGTLFASRLVTTFIQGISASLIPGIAGVVIAIGMITMLIAKFGFMWAIEMDRHNHWWVLFLIGSVFWALFAFGYELRPF